VQRRPDTTTIGVEFNLPLYAGWATQNRVSEAVALEDKSRNDLEGARRAVTQLTREVYLGLIAGQGQVRALEAAEASSQSALEANRLGYQVGVRINIDVLNAQSQLFETKAKLAKARFDYLVGTLRLKQAVGTLTPEDLKPINALLKP
jgi:outer membrane protein